MQVSAIRNYLTFDLNPHVLRGAFYHAASASNVVDVQVRQFALGDGVYMGTSHLTYDLFSTFSRSFFNTRIFFEQCGDRRSFQLEFKTTIFKYGDFRADDIAYHVLRRFIETLTEILNINAVLTERGTYGRRW